VWHPVSGAIVQAIPADRYGRGLFMASGSTASAALTIIPTLQSSTASATPGATITVSGTGYAAGERAPFGERLGLWAFWLYNGGLLLWIALNFLPIGWQQLNAVFEHGFAYARSMAFYDTMLIWQWMRLPGDVLFAAAAMLMAWDFLIKLSPLYPQLAKRMLGPRGVPLAPKPGESMSHAANRSRNGPPAIRSADSRFASMLPSSTIAAYQKVLTAR